MRKTIWLATSLIAAGPAGAEGVLPDAPLEWRRPVAPAPGAALLIETGKDDGLASLAISRGMTVILIDLDKLPATVRDGALRDLARKVRETSGAKRVIAHGAGAAGAALVATGDAFDGLLLQDVATAAPKAPRSIYLWGSDAYWRAPKTTPGPETAKERRFFLPGLASSGASTNCAAPPNTRSAAPALRALLVALDDWTKGVKPPPSRIPGAADLVEARTIVWPKIPNLPTPPSAEAIPKIDADGNETAGLRLPDQALPIATFTSFNAKKDPKGDACAAGAMLPFPSTKADREKTSDPRASLMERYGSRAYFVATMRVIADKLVKERLLLKEDADAYVAAAKQAPF